MIDSRCQNQRTGTGRLAADSNYSDMLKWVCLKIRSRFFVFLGVLCVRLFSVLVTISLKAAKTDKENGRKFRVNQYQILNGLPIPVTEC